MRDDRAHRRLVVAVDGGYARVAGRSEAEQDDGGAALGQRVGHAGSGAQPGDQHAVDATLDERVDLRALGSEVTGAVDDEQRVAGLARTPLGAECQLGVDRVGLVGHDQPEHAGDTLAQRPGDPVRAVAKLLDGIVDARAGNRGDLARAAHDVRDGRFRHAREPRDILERGGHGAPISQPASARARAEASIEASGASSGSSCSIAITPS